MIRKMMLLAAGAVLGVLLFASPALAGGDGYTPMNVTATVNSDGTVTLTGDNCPPNSPVTYVVRRGAVQSIRSAPIGNTPIIDEGAGTSDDSGSFSFDTNTLPNGRFNITVTCGGQASVLSAQIGAAQSGGQGNVGGGNLATTGSDSSIPLARLGVILVATGGVALYAAKKRKGRRAAFVNA